MIDHEKLYRITRCAVNRYTRGNWRLEQVKDDLVQEVVLTAIDVESKGKLFGKSSYKWFIDRAVRKMFGDEGSHKNKAIKNTSYIGPAFESILSSSYSISPDRLACVSIAKARLHKVFSRLCDTQKKAAALLLLGESTSGWDRCRATIHLAQTRVIDKINSGGDDDC